MTMLIPTRAEIAELVMALGVTAESIKEIEDGLCRSYKARKLSDIRDRVRQFLELEGEDALSHEGFTATLSPPPADLWLDVSSEALTDAVILTAFRAGLLTLDKAQYRSEKRSTAELDAFRSAVVTGAGTRRLSIGRAE